MEGAEHHDKMRESLHHHIMKMPEGSSAILVSYDPQSKNGSVVSNMENTEVARLLKDILVESERRN